MFFQVASQHEPLDFFFWFHSHHSNPSFSDTIIPESPRLADLLFLHDAYSFPRKREDGGCAGTGAKGKIDGALLYVHTLATQLVFSG